MLNPTQETKAPAGQRGDAEVALPDSLIPFCQAPQRFLLERAIAFGPLSRFRLSQEHFVLLAEPAAIHDVLFGSQDDFEKGELYDIPRLLGDGLVTADGAHWAEQHKLLAPLFSGPRMRRLGGLIVDLVQALLEDWAGRPPGAPLDLLRATKRLAFDVVSRGLLGLEPGTLADELFAALDTIDRTEAVRLHYLAKRLQPGLSFERSDMAAAIERFDEVATALVDERLARPAQPDDCLGAAVSLPAFRALTPARQRSLLRETVGTLLSAGYMTTGETLFWALYYLARHPLEQARARAEPAAKQASGTSGVLLDAPPFLTAVINESLRLHPPVWWAGRVARRPLRILGEEIAPGTRVICSPYVLQRLPSLWPEAEAFRPARFLRDAAEPLPPRAFIPFSSGPRVCLGRGLALMEMSALLSGALGRFELRINDDATPELAATYSMQPRQPVHFLLRPLP